MILYPRLGVDFRLAMLSPPFTVATAIPRPPFIAVAHQSSSSGAAAYQAAIPPTLAAQAEGPGPLILTTVAD